MVLVLDPSPPEAGKVPAKSESAAGSGATPPQTVPVKLSLVPDHSQMYEMPLQREAAEEVVALAYAAAGRDAVTIVLTSVLPEVDRLIYEIERTIDPEPTMVNSGDKAKDAYRLLFEAALDQAWLAYEALEEVDIEARAIFMEMLEAAHGATQFSLYGFVEASRNFAGPPVPDIQPMRDGGDTYRALRAAVLELDAAARALHEAEHLLESSRSEKTFLDLTELLNLVTAGAVPGPPPVSRSVSAAVTNVQAATASYANVFSKHAERFPALAMVGGGIVGVTTEWDRAEVEAMANDTARYDNRLDVQIRSQLGDACRTTWNSGPAFARGVFEDADEVIDRARKLVEISGPEGAYAHHPLWRYPLIILGALERLGYTPGTLPHAAATDVLRKSAEIKKQRDEEEAAISRALDWASFGFGVLSFIPVVGQLAVTAAFAVSAAQAVRAASTFSTSREEARAFGPFAPDLGLVDPEGAGWVLMAFVGLTFDVIPVLEACGAIAGRLVRLKALPRPATPGLADVAANAYSFASLVTAEKAKAAGVDE